MSTHRFEPAHYHTTLGSHSPVLRIRDGDTVVTTTLDARGLDARGTQAGPRGNPQTGPFYIEGAEPGDTVGVRLDRLTPSRRTGWSVVSIAPNVVDPSHVPEMPARDTVEWEVDAERRVVTLAEPMPGLGRLSLPLAPMLGCFGVAPPGGQAVSSATCGRWGGNMDYRGFTEGVTAFFPVCAPGALFHLGDGHAAQGDGEIAGTGVETSFEVQFTVRLVKGTRGEWPRGENETHLFTLGAARPLDQAVQHATTEMVRWLGADYGLDARAASTLLGQCVEYDLGNVYNPAYAMVCKVRKQVLLDLRRPR